MVGNGRRKKERGMFFVCFVFVCVGVGVVGIVVVVVVVLTKL